MRVISSILGSLLFLLLFIACLPLIPLVILYELTPYRRQLRRDIEDSALAVLIRRGIEMHCGEIRKEVSQDLKKNISPGDVVVALRRLLEGGYVEYRYVTKGEKRNGHLMDPKYRYFRAKKGRGRRRKRELKEKFSLRDILGGYLPEPGRA